jgi:hypothetical protein
VKPLKLETLYLFGYRRVRYTGKGLTIGT